MKISIVTVCYNAAATIGDTFDAVARQTYTNVEHVVVDGASKDGTAELIQARFGDAGNWLSEPDRGLYDAMNKGIARASGDVIGTLNADDVYADETVLAQVAEVFEDPTVEACYADLIFVDQHDPDKVVRRWTSCDYRDGLFEGGWMPAHPTFFVRRSVYERFGDFDLSFARQSDFDLTMRFLAVHGIKSVYVPKLWVKMRMGGISNNSVVGVIKGNIEAYRACLKNGLEVSPLFIPRKILSRIPQFFKKPTPVA